MTGKRKNRGKEDSLRRNNGQKARAGEERKQGGKAGHEMRRRMKQAEEISKKPDERREPRGGQKPKQVREGGRGWRHNNRRGRNQQRGKSRRHRRRRRNRGRAAKRGHKTKPGRTVLRGSRMGTRAIGAFTGRKSTRRALAAIMGLGTEITPGRELTESGMMAKILTTEALRSSIFRLQVLHKDAKMKKAGDGS